MAFDGIAVCIIAQELNDKLRNTRVMKIYQNDRHSIVFHLRLPGESCKLIISADPVYPRIHTTKEDLENPLMPPAFCMLLRKHLEPSRILTIKQHELERLILISFEAYDELLGQTEKTLVFELMGRHSNLILVNKDGYILDGIHRVSEDQNPVRIVMPGVKYSFPPDQGKENPRNVDSERFITDIRLLEPTTQLYKGLLQHYQGIGPEAAKEIVRRSDLDPALMKQETGPEQWKLLWNSFSAFFSQKDTPVLVPRNNNGQDFYAYQLSGVDRQIFFPDLDSLLDNYYSCRIKNERVRQIGSTLKKRLKTHLQRLVRKEALQRHTLKDAANAKVWQKLGELVTANLYAIKKGDSVVEVIDYYEEDQRALRIDLDPALTPSRNAQRYYKKYIKARNSEKVTRQQLQKTLRERRYIEETLVHINFADSIDTLHEIKEELTRLGYIKQKTQKQKKTVAKGYDEYLSVDGISVFVGRNNQQNDQLTFRVAKPDDIWLHAQKIPGSHVIIRCDQTVPDTTLAQAATLAAYYSKARTSPKVPVDYTARKHVRKPNSAKPGYVIYDHFNTVTVDPTKNDILTKKRP